MANVLTRAAKGSPLTHTELDSNFSNLDNNKTGYVSGDGGVQSQPTSKSTGVTLNTKCGQITMSSASLAANTVVSFVLTNNKIAATDLLVLNHVSGGTIGGYTLNAAAAAGSATIYVRNVTAGALSEAVVIGFAVVKSVIS